MRSFIEKLYTKGNSCPVRPYGSSKPHHSTSQVSNNRSIQIINAYNFPNSLPITNVFHCHLRVRIYHYGTQWLRLPKAANRGPAMRDPTIPSPHMPRPHQPSPNASTR